MFKGTGILQYDPKARIRFDPWWLILKTDEQIVKYYQYWILKYYAAKFEKTVWGSHVSVIRGSEPKHKNLWKKYQGKKIEFSYDNNIYQANPKFLCINAYSEELQHIREELGLSPIPPYGFHITIGRLHPTTINKNE